MKWFGLHDFCFPLLEKRSVVAGLAGNFGGKIDCDPFQWLGVEDRNRFAQASKRGSFNTKLLLQVAEFTGLPDPTQRCDGWVEHVQQHAQAVLIDVQVSYVFPITIAAGFMERLEQFAEFRKVL